MWGSKFALFVIGTGRVKLLYGIGSAGDKTMRGAVTAHNPLLEQRTVFQCQFIDLANRVQPSVELTLAPGTASLPFLAGIACVC
jgi:hypothetical protein